MDRLTTTGEWAKHLRRMKRFFWHGERKAVRKEILQQLEDEQLKDVPDQPADNTTPGANLPAPVQSNPASAPGRK